MPFTTTTRTIQEADNPQFELLAINAQTLLGNTGDLPPYVPVFDDGGTPTIVSTASPFPVTIISGTVTTGGLTDAELRATPVPVSGTVTATPSGTQDVNIASDAAGLALAANQQTDALTDAELRASDVGTAEAAKALSHKTGSISSSGDNTIHTTTAGFKVRIFKFEIVPDPASTNHTEYLLKTGTTEHAGWWLNKNGAGHFASPVNFNYFFAGGDNEDVVVNLSQATTCRWNLWYEEVAI